MTPATAARPAPSRLARLAMAVAVLSMAIAAVTVIRLALAAGEQIDALGTANADSTQWALAQTEVEFVSFQLAVEDAVHHDLPDLAEVRKRFDIVFSRLATIRHGKVFQILLADPQVEDRVLAIQAFLDRSVPLIDADDDTLQAALPGLDSGAVAIRNDLRWLSLQGVKVFSQSAEIQREQVFTTLLRLALLTFCFFVVLILSLVALALSARRARTEAARRADASARFEAIVRTSIDAIIVADRDGRVTEFNAAAEQVFGYTSREALGQPIETLIIPPDQRQSHRDGMARHRAGGTPRVLGRGRVRLAAQRKDGSLIQTEVAITSARARGEEVFVAYLRDVTAQLAAEAELVETRDRAVAGEKAKADLLAVMSHEMRTPLNGMLGTLELIADTPLTEKQADYLQIIGRSGRILLQHVNDVLDVSRLDSGKMEFHDMDFDPLELVQDVVAGQIELARASGNRIEIAADGPPTLYRGDETRVQQILINLIGNAVKFTRDGIITARVRRNAADLVFEISDTGIGIAPEQAARIFEDFVTLDSSYRRSAEGTGLGLGICQRIASAMNGNISVDSIPGKGSTFRVALPLPPVKPAASPLATDTKTSPTRPRGKGGLHLLVVEDNQINRLVVREMLGKLGHQVTEAVTGNEGVSRASEQAFDAILMDISMPGMDGVTATRAIRSGNGPCATVPIFALTAHALPADLQRFREAGMTDAMTKPISGAVLAKTLSQVTPTPSPVAAAPQDGDTDLLDLAVIAELTDLIGPEGLGPMFGEFVTETEATLAGLKQMIGPDMDFGSFERTSHKIAGSAAVFGAKAMRQSLLALEAAARAGNPTPIADGFPETLGVWETTKRALGARLGRKAA